MNWYRFVKIAGPTQKIQKYKISDPVLQSFIYKYENLIPWNSITYADDIQSYIKQVLLKELYSRIDPTSDNNQYTKDIDLEAQMMANPNNPQIQQARQIYQQDPQGAKKKVLEVVNKGKGDEFSRWWLYITEDNDIYQENPAFQFLILKPVIDSSPESTHAPPTNLNAQAVASVWGQIKDDPHMNVRKSYRKALSEASQEGLQKIDLGDQSGWIRVPSKANDQANFEENIKKLMAISCGMGWCIAQREFAEQYLEQGDFWILLEGGTPKIAIRLVQTDANYVQEIRGRGNEDSSLMPYWEKIAKFLEESDFNYQHNEQYRTLREFVEFNKRVDALAEDGKREEATEFIKRTDDGVLKLSNKNKKLFPELIEWAVKRYASDMHHSIESTVIGNTWLVGVDRPNDLSDEAMEKIENSEAYGEILNLTDEIMDQYNKLPEFMLNKMPPSLVGKVACVYYLRFAYSPYSWDTYPTEIKKEIGLDRASSYYYNMIKESSAVALLPAQWSYMPEEIKQNIGLEKLADLLANSLVTAHDKKDSFGHLVSLWRELPDDIRNTLNDEQKQKITKIFMEYNKSFEYNTIGQHPVFPEELEGYMSLEDQADSWIPFIRFLPDSYTDIAGVPFKGDSYMQGMEIPSDVLDYLIESGLGDKAAAEGYMQKISTRPQIYSDIKSERIKNLIDLNYVKESISKVLEKYPQTFNNKKLIELSKSLFDIEDVKHFARQVLVSSATFFENNAAPELIELITPQERIQAWDNDIRKAIQSDYLWYNNFNDIPKDVVPHLSPDVKQLMTNIVTSILREKPQDINNFDSDIVDAFVPDEFFPEMNKSLEDITPEYYMYNLSNLSGRSFNLLSPKNQELVLQSVLKRLDEQASRWQYAGKALSALSENTVRVLQQKYPNELMAILNKVFMNKHAPKNMLYENIPLYLRTALPQNIMQMVIEDYRQHFEFDKQFSGTDKTRLAKYWAKIPDEIKPHLQDLAA